MANAPSLRRSIEIALCIVGISLLGVAFGETFARWNYQAQQERALERGLAVPVNTQQRAIAITPEHATRTTTEVVGRANPAEPDTSERLAASTPRIETKRRATTDDPTALGRIEIPRLGVAAIVQEGADERTLARAVGLVPGSAHPGQLGNMVLAGHRDTFFRPLRKIKVNDRIRMIVPPHTYEYRVQSMRVVAPEETNVLDSNGVEELTLVTCYPFRFVGSAPERFIVNAARVN